VCDKGCVVNAGDNSCATKCQCPLSADGKPVCGGTVDPSCKLDPSIIYQCPGNAGSDPEIVQICNPGTACNTDKNGDASCGSDTCNCIGKQQRCSSFFPEKCGLKDSSIYRCSRTGEPKFVSSCPDDTVCITLVDGATCVSKDCKCTVDGTVCGRAFSPSCPLSETSLYTCKKGKAPVLLKDCLPNRCLSSVAEISATAVFEAADAMDTCSDPCTCTSKGKVCYYLLRWFVSPFLWSLNRQ